MRKPRYYLLRFASVDHYRPLADRLAREGIQFFGYPSGLPSDDVTHNPCLIVPSTDARKLPGGPRAPMLHKHPHQDDDQTPDGVPMVKITPERFAELDPYYDT